MNKRITAGIADTDKFIDYMGHSEIKNLYMQLDHGCVFMSGITDIVAMKLMDYCTR